MAAATSTFDRLRETTRDALHQGIRRAQADSPPNLARQLDRLDGWLREQEKRSDDVRNKLSERLTDFEHDVRAALAAGVRKLEGFVRP